MSDQLNSLVSLRFILAHFLQSTESFDNFLQKWIRFKRKELQELSTRATFDAGNVAGAGQNRTAGKCLCISWEPGWQDIYVIVFLTVSESGDWKVLHVEIKLGCV